MLKSIAEKLFSKLGAIYSMLSLFALIHLVILLGMAGYAYLTGGIDRAKIEKIAAVIRGDETQEPERAQTEEVIAGSQGSAETSTQMITEAVEKEEMEQLRAGRGRADIRNFDIMVDRRALQLQKDQEAHQRRVALYEAQLRKRRERELSDAHKKTIDTIGSMDAKKARDFLMNTSQADVIKILLALPDRTRKGILEACKTQEQITWRDRTLNAMLRQPALAGGGT